MLGVTLAASDYLERLERELSLLDASALQSWADLIYQAWQHDRFVFVFGNGGSATTATHISEDLGKSLLPEEDLLRGTGKRLKILSLTDNVGWIMAVGNDLGYAQVFSQQLMNYARPGDVAIAISGSGNSPNVLTAVEWANEHGVTTFALTGYDGGRLKRMAHAGLHVAIDDMGMVESIHLAAFHWVLNDVFARIHRKGRYQLAATREQPVFSS